MFSTRTNTFLRIESALQLREIRVRVNSPKEDRFELIIKPLSNRLHQSRSSLHTWFIPEFENSNVGSSKGIVEEEGTRTWFLLRKKSKNCCRTRGAVQGPVYFVVDIVDKWRKMADWVRICQVINNFTGNMWLEVTPLSLTHCTVWSFD